MILAGIDEAGYGPLLGPLVVSATAFEIPFAAAELPTETAALPCLWKMLKPAIAKKAPAKKGRILIADSKVVHALADGNRQLERGVLAMLRAWKALTFVATPDAPTPPAPAAANANTLVELLDCSTDPILEHPWYAAKNALLPWLCEEGDLAI